MLRKFAIALLATSVVTGAAFAAQPSGNASSTAPAITTGAKSQTAAVSTNPAKHLRKHVRKHARSHFAHGKIHGKKMAYHFKSGKTHKAHLARTMSGAKVTKTGTVKSAKLHATRSSTN
jgi:hypothetical protein